jgi:hypothetical protein
MLMKSKKRRWSNTNIGIDWAYTEMCERRREGINLVIKTSSKIELL